MMKQLLLILEILLYNGRSISQIESYYGEKYANNLEIEISNISSLLDDTSLTDTEKINAAQNEGWVPTTSMLINIADLRNLYQDAKNYYEYVQFKRANFKCTGLEYDNNTSRIIKMKFEYTGMGV